MEARKRVDELFDEAVVRPPQEREAFVAAACGGDVALRDEVLSLIAYADEADRFMGEPAAGAETQKLPLSPGGRLGRYEILGLVGAGGMGEVYRARDPRLGRDVAIKVLPDALAGDGDALPRLEREARAVAALNHPGIATVYEIGEHDGAPFLSMELIEGRTLKDRLDEGPLPTKDLLELASQIARALAKAHGAGIVHRDLKPANLMVTIDGFAKILDFGLARRASVGSDDAGPITREGPAFGTPPYVSPEQAAGRPLDHRSDQFSFGTILYEMATGRRVFERETAAQTLAAVIQDEPTPLRRLDAGIPADLAAIVERCLAKDPAERYESTADLVAALSHASSVALSGSASRRRFRWSLLAAVALVGVVVSSLGRPPRPRSPAPSGEPRDAVLDALPFTTYQGREAEPSFSPDGSELAFTWDGPTQDNRDVYVKAIGAEQPLRLTSDPARDGSPAWSPDGTLVAFLREVPGRGSEVRVVPPTGGPERRIGEVQARADDGLAWSRDGHTVAVADRAAPGDPLGLVLLDTVDGSRRRLTSPSLPSWDTQPAFSPDGRTIAFRRPPFSGVFIVPAEGGEPRELVEAGSREGRIAWAPDGASLLLASERLARRGEPPRAAPGGAGTRPVWRVPLDGSPVRPLGGSYVVDVAVAASGSLPRVAYSEQTVDWDIWRLDLRRRKWMEGGAFVASTKFDGNPQFSPDGGHVAFTSARGGLPEVWVADGNGAQALPLTAVGTNGDVGAPRWSPDSRSIAFDFSPVGGTNVDVYVVDASGGTPRRVTFAPGVDAQPSWSRDGRWIYFASNRSGQWQVWKAPPEGERSGSATQVTRGGGFAAIESPDGRHLYFSRRLSGHQNSTNAIWRIQVGGDREEAVVESYRSSSGSWDVARDGIYFVDEEPGSAGGHWVLRFLRIGQRHPTDISRLPRPPFLAGPAVSVSPDGRFLLSTQGQGGSDLMLAEFPDARRDGAAEK